MNANNNNHEHNAAAQILIHRIQSFARESRQKRQHCLFSTLVSNDSFSKRKRKHDGGFKTTKAHEENEEAAIITIQKSFRSYSVRNYLHKEGIHPFINRHEHHQSDDVNIDQNGNNHQIDWNRMTIHQNAHTQTRAIEKKKQIAWRKVQIDCCHKRKRERQLTISRYYQLDHTFMNDIQRHLKTIKKMKIKYDILARKRSTTTAITTTKKQNGSVCGGDNGNARPYSIVEKNDNNPTNPEETTSIQQELLKTLVPPSYSQRCQDRRVHFDEINKTIQEQISLVTKLSIKSVTMKESRYNMIQSNQAKWKSVQYAIDFFNTKSKALLSSIKKMPTSSDEKPINMVEEWLAQQQRIIIHALIECDNVQEVLLETECNRLEHEVDVLDSSSQIFITMLECILNIEMWEAERFSIRKSISSFSTDDVNKNACKIFSADEANTYFDLIDDNQMKLNCARKKDLPRICEVSGDFYHTQLQHMERDVCFHHHVDGNDEIKATRQSCSELLEYNNRDKWSVIDWMNKFTKNVIQLQEDEMNGAGFIVGDNYEKTRSRLKGTQSYVHERRELLQAMMVKEPNDKSPQSQDAYLGSGSGPSNLTKLRWLLFGSSTKLESVNKDATRLLNDMKRMRFCSSALFHRHQIVPAMIRLVKRGEDPELRMMMTVVKKTMNNQNSSNVAGIVSLKFTVGKEETGVFSAENDRNEERGLPFYQSRINLGNHVETVLWVQISSKNVSFITGLCLKDKEISSTRSEGLTRDEVVGHENLRCVLCIERDQSETQIISSIQITYANTTESDILEKDYEMIPTRLSIFGLTDAHLWISFSNRLANNTTTSLSRMKTQLDEYESMLSSHPEDYLLKGLVEEMERRIEITKRKEKEQRGLKHNHIEYITEFLALSEKDIRGLKKTFKSIDNNRDGLITVEEIVEFVQEPMSIVPIIKGCIRLSLGGAKLINEKLGFGEFSRALGSFAMFSFAEIVKCLFCSIDEQGFGFLLRNDYYHFLAMLHPKKDITTVVISLRDTAIPESMSFILFKNLALKFPKLIFPIFRFQQSIRSICLGKSWWDRKMRKFMSAKKIVLLQEQQMNK